MIPSKTYASANTNIILHTKTVIDIEIDQWNEFYICANGESEISACKIETEMLRFVKLGR